MSDNNILFRIGHTLRELRRTKGWSQEKLSEVCKVDRSFLGKVERGEVNISILTLCEITKALGVQVKDVL